MRMPKPAGKSVPVCCRVLSSRGARRALSPTQAVPNKKLLLLKNSPRLKFQLLRKALPVGTRRKVLGTEITFFSLPLRNLSCLDLCQRFSHPQVHRGYRICSRVQSAIPHGAELLRCRCPDSAKDPGLPPAQGGRCGTMHLEIALCHVGFSSQ